MTIADKLRQLEALYRLYEDITGEVEFVCTKGCADCCTRNVVITTLEGYRLAEHLAEGRENVFASLRTDAGAPRFIPKMTTNRFAKLCMEGMEPPEEKLAPAETRCAILSESTCPVYPLRPFNCRCMLSKSRCADTGFAQIDDFTVTVNTVFLQLIEHIDAEGCSGNLVDVLLYFASETNRRRYRTGNHICGEAALIPNHPIPVLMIPPEHRLRLGPWMRSIHQHLSI